MSGELDLVLEEVREITAAALDRQRTEPFGIYAWGPSEPAAAAARYVERAVFGETFGNTPEILTREYGKYEDASLFFAVVDHRRRLPVGMTRAILPSHAGFKSLNDIERDWGQPVDGVLARTGLELPREHVWDCATVATMPDYRRGALYGLVGMALYHAVATTSMRCGFRWWVAIVDAPVLRVLQWRLGRPFTEYAGVPKAAYLGSPSSVPVYSDLRAWEARLARQDPMMHDIVFRGDGLAPVVATPDWDRIEQLVRAVSPLVKPSSAPGATA